MGDPAEWLMKIAWGNVSVMRGHVTVKLVHPNNVNGTGWNPASLLFAECDEVVRANRHAVGVAKTGGVELEIFPVL